MHSSLKNMHLTDGDKNTLDRKSLFKGKKETERKYADGLAG